MTNDIESQRKHLLGCMEKLNNRAIRDLRLFSDCPENRLPLLFKDAVWLFTHVIRYAIEIRYAEHLAREFNSNADLEDQVPLVFNTEQKQLEAANAAVELLCILGVRMSLDTQPLRIALSEMRSLMTSSSDLHSHHASREVWPHIIDVVGRHLSSSAMGRLVVAAAQADAVLTQLRVVLAERLEGFGPALATRKALLVGVKKGSQGDSKMILEALIRSDGLRVGLNQLCKKIYNGRSEEYEESLAASILRLNLQLKALKISCYIERESNVYFVASGVYDPLLRRK